ncbi:MAG: alpha/beta fold hydrolase [Bdellovibrionales bacterium]|nr:alpha/beta fold hydrolase [Bdellovibrionales bacterium]
MAEESQFVELSGGARLHLRRFRPETPSGAEPVVVLVHGAIENGRIFYSASGKGLAPYLASQGFEVFVPDLGGRGGSTPKIARGSNHGQNESIVEELPAISDHVAGIAGGREQHWGAHSWGGVLILSALARHPRLRPRIKRLLFVASKRSVKQLNLEILWKIHLLWNRFSFWMVKRHGYLPARERGFGSDNESRLSHWESVRWVRPGPWVDPRDGFDYGAALAALDPDEKPEMLFVTGAADRALGHPGDVRELILEVGPGPKRFEILGKAFGNRADYGHVDILTHPLAPEDHFPRLARWLSRGE